MFYGHAMNYIAINLILHVKQAGFTMPVADVL
jgi:hypothetical protein